jgi:hypothetical protein
MILLKISEPAAWSHFATETVQAVFHPWISTLLTLEAGDSLMSQ